MDDVFVYLVDMPPKVKEMVVPCADGFTIYLDEKLDETEQMVSYLHAVSHILNGDFEKSNVQEIEAKAGGIV
jgi:hypothetical protein